MLSHGEMLFQTCYLKLGENFEKTITVWLTFQNYNAAISTPLTINQLKIKLRGVRLLKLMSILSRFF